MTTAYYNEIEPYCVQWIGNLGAAGHVAKGWVDDRSIAIVQPDDVRRFSQCHFFAGIAVWSYALRCAGWPDDRKVWTGSCPCQPFSCAGKRKGTADARHLWPEWFRLIRECRPSVILGEQVATPDTVGPSRQNASVQEMLDREAVFRVLRELQGEAADLMQGVRSKIGENKEAKEPGLNDPEIQAVEGREARSCACECSKAPRKDEGDSVRSGPVRNPSEDQLGEMRNDGHSFRSDNTESVECSISGPDRTREGIHKVQCSCCPVCGERHGEYLGSPENCGNCECDIAEAPGSVSRLFESLGGEAKEKNRFPWFDVIRADLEGIGYTVGAVVAPAAGFGAPHQRHRLYFVAHTGGVGRQTGGASEPGYQGGPAFINDGSAQGFVGDSAQRGQPMRGGSPGSCGRAAFPEQSGPVAESKDTDGRSEQQTERAGSGRGGPSGSGELGNAISARLEGWSGEQRNDGTECAAIERASGPIDIAGPVNGFWHDAEWIACTDGKARAAKPGTFPLAYDAATRVGRLRAYGNAIVAEQAAEFIKAFIESPIGQAINLIETTKDKTK